jgi:hypothetical protein
MINPPDHRGWGGGDLIKAKNLEIFGFSSYLLAF